jgi:hypothetical protein
MDDMILMALVTRFVRWFVRDGVPNLMSGLDRGVQSYVREAKANERRHAS